MKFIKFKAYLNNEKCTYKGLCKNEYCKGNFIVSESTVLWIGRNETKCTCNLLVDHVAMVQKVPAPKAVPSTLPN